MGEKKTLDKVAGQHQSMSRHERLVRNRPFGDIKGRMESKFRLPVAGGSQHSMGDRGKWCGARGQVISRPVLP